MSTNRFAALGDDDDAPRRAAPPPKPTLPRRTCAVAKADFERWHGRRFGTANPQRMENTFWQAMVRTKSQAYNARLLFEGRNAFELDEPVWCYHRFGRTVTWLPDGRVVLIAGEHEDGYDPDFLIYNDVVVITPETEAIEIYGYPRSVFPPTDFHSATFVPSTAQRVPDAIYIIGNVGYTEDRRADVTPVYRLELDTMAIHAVRTTGEGPGWVREHTAWLEDSDKDEPAPEASLASLQSLCAKRLETMGVTAKRLAVTSHPPAAVDCVAAAWAVATRRRGCIYVHGGESVLEEKDSEEERARVARTHVLDLATMQWSVRQYAGAGEKQPSAPAWHHTVTVGDLAGLKFLDADLVRAPDAAAPPRAHSGSGGRGHAGTGGRAKGRADAGKGKGGRSGKGRGRRS